LTAIWTLRPIQPTYCKLKGPPSERAGLIHGYFGMGEASEAARLEAQRARANFKAMLERGA
jgi:hypothetical protein